MRCHEKLIAVFWVALSLVGCSVGPDYFRQPVMTPAKFKEAKGKSLIVTGNHQDWKKAQPADDFNRGKWWTVFNDKKLNSLEEHLNTSNQNIIAAYANYKQAMALVDQASASYWPTLDFNTSIIRQKSSGSSTSFAAVTTTGQSNTGAAVTSGGGSSSNINSTHQLIFNAAWAPDVWGLVRRTVEASRAGAQASEALLDNTRLLAQGALAQYYFQLRTLDADQVLLDRTVNDYKRAMQLTDHQYQSGVAARADLVQAQATLQAAQSLAINNKVNRAIYEHAIAVLIGEPPATFALKSMPLRALPPAIPVGLPSELLERRPDIAQAERLMAQANAQIGVAVAAYYPQLTLTGNLNDSGSGGFSRLFSVPDFGWAYGPLINQFMFDGGQRAATVAAASAGYRASVASYRNVVLTAFQNVEDNLSTLQILANQSVIQNQAAKSAEEALRLVMNQYKSGIVPYANVITSQVNAFNAQKTAVDLVGLRMNAAVGLILALGGGWHECREINVQGPG